MYLSIPFFRWCLCVCECWMKISNKIQVQWTMNESYVTEYMRVSGSKILVINNQMRIQFWLTKWNWKMITRRWIDSYCQSCAARGGTSGVVIPENFNKIIMNSLRVLLKYFISNFKHTHKRTCTGKGKKENLVRIEKGK